VDDRPGGGSVLYVRPARAFMMISRIAATAARQTSASSNGLPRSIDLPKTVLGIGIADRDVAAAL